MIAFDTNILVYAQERSDDPRHRQAIVLLDRASISGAVIPSQVLAEFLNVCVRKLGTPPIDAIDQVAEYLDLFACPATLPDDLFGAIRRTSAYSLQFFDALIASVAERGGATVLLSEDMQDGQEIERLKVLNPFNLANTADIDAALGA